MLLLQTMADIHKHTETPFPMVVDENINYRIIKLCYSSTYASRELRILLTKCPPIFGLWYPYEHSVTLTYRLFWSLFVSITHGSLGAGVQVPALPNLISLERVVACLLVGACDATGQLDVLRERSCTIGR